ncbi:MAG: hypothetical protein R3D31_11855 [Hyphomicrobiaceae bacterium]
MAMSDHEVIPRFRANGLMPAASQTHAKARTQSDASILKRQASLGADLEGAADPRRGWAKCSPIDECNFAVGPSWVPHHGCQILAEI